MYDNCLGTRSSGQPPAVRTSFLPYERTDSSSLLVPRVLDYLTLETYYIPTDCVKDRLSGLVGVPSRPLAKKESAEKSRGLTDDTGEEFLCHSRSLLELLHSVGTCNAHTHYIPGHDSHLKWGVEDASGAKRY